MNSITDLTLAIGESHGAGAIHLSSVATRQLLGDGSVWDGIVEVFMLSRHPKAKTAYAWTEESKDAGKPARHVIVLHLPPVDSPRTAVCAAYA